MATKAKREKKKAGGQPRRPQLSQGQMRRLKREREAVRDLERAMVDGVKGHTLSSEEEAALGKREPGELTYKEMFQLAAAAGMRGSVREGIIHVAAEDAADESKERERVIKARFTDSEKRAIRLGAAMVDQSIASFVRTGAIAWAVMMKLVDADPRLSGQRVPELDSEKEPDGEEEEIIRRLYPE